MDDAHDKPVREAMLDLAARYHDLDVIGAKVSTPDRARLVAAADLVLADDFDLAEEALAAGVPVLVPGDGRGLTEALHAGSARQVDPTTHALVTEISALLDSRLRRDSMSANGSPYGDGLAAGRIAQATAALLGHGQFPDPMPARPQAASPAEGAPHGRRRFLGPVVDQWRPVRGAQAARPGRRGGVEPRRTGG
ncbi:UDP-N-acetylglucosamine 2-epimerase [Paractinoplanes durhamensis]|uniref:UDP-N-acetylglucosamine 2-epimerase n=1 Tax=Paractinoplanes durhamensis TaxID=113563 RepID=UPI00363AE122